ncbi:hypothetical protein BD779DRAFT_1676116 [Infundibulicybe gibba]|nr:hypothetical protein BD779DRAFT_1676116 [Infundibulicybe gibba]
MEDENEVLDWGNEDDEHQESHKRGLVSDLDRRGSGDGEDVEDSVSLGDDEEQDFYPYREPSGGNGATTNGEHNSNPFSSSPRTEQPSRQARRDSSAHSQKPSSVVGTPPKQRQQQSPGLQRSQPRITHALPPKPVVANVPFLHPSHPSIVEATAMSRSAARNDSSKKNNNTTSAPRSLSVDQDTAPLPPHWEARQPRSGGREVYFYNTLTHESTWSRPVSSNPNLPPNPPRSAHRRSSSVSLGARPQSPPRPDQSQSFRSTRPPPQLDIEFTDAQSSVTQAVTSSTASAALSYEDRHYRPAGAEAAPLSVDVRPRRNPDAVDLPSSQVHQASYTQASPHSRARSLSPSPLPQFGGPPQRGGRPYIARGNHHSGRGSRNAGISVEHHSQRRRDPSPAANFPARHRNLSPVPHSDSIGSHASRAQYKPRRHAEPDAGAPFDALVSEGRDRHSRGDRVRGRARDRDQDSPSRDMLVQQSQNQLSASRHRSPSPRPRPERKPESPRPDEHNDHQLLPSGIADPSAKNGRPIEPQEPTQPVPTAAPPVIVNSMPPPAPQVPRPRNRPSRFDRPTPLPPKPKSPSSEVIPAEGPPGEHEVRPDVDAPLPHQQRAGERDLDREHPKLMTSSVPKQIDSPPRVSASNYGSRADPSSALANPDKLDSPSETSGQATRPKRIPLPPQEASFREIHPPWVGPPRPATGDSNYHDAPGVLRSIPDQTVPPPPHLHRYEDRNGAPPGSRFPPQLRNGRTVSERHSTRFGGDSRPTDLPEELMDTNPDGFPAMPVAEREPLGAGMYADREPNGSGSDVVPRAPRAMGREGPVVSAVPIPTRGSSFRDRSRDSSPPPSHSIGSVRDGRRGYDNRIDAPGWDGVTRDEYHTGADNRAYRNREPRSHPHEYPPRPPQNLGMHNLSGMNNSMTGNRQGPMSASHPEPNFPPPGSQRPGDAPPPHRPNYANTDMKNRGRERVTPPKESFERIPALYARNTGNQSDRYRPGPPPEFEENQHRFNNAPPYHQRPHQRGPDDVDRPRRDGPYPFDEKLRGENLIPPRPVRNYQSHPRPSVPSPPHVDPVPRPKPALNVGSDYRAVTPPPISREPSVSSQHWEESFTSDPGRRSAHPPRHSDETRSAGHDGGGSDSGAKRQPLPEPMDGAPPPERVRFDRPMANDRGYPHHGRLQERLGGRYVEHPQQPQHQHHQQRYPPESGSVRQQHPLPANPSLHAGRDTNLPNNERYRGGPPGDERQHSWTENNDRRERQRSREMWAGHDQPPSSHPRQHHPGHPHVYEREPVYQPSDGRDMRETYDRDVMDQDSRSKPIRIRRPPPPSFAPPPGGEDATRLNFEGRSFDSHPRNREFGPDRDHDKDFPDRFTRAPASRRGGSLLDRLSIGHGPTDQGDPAPMHVDSPSLRERVQVPSKRDHEEMDVDDVGDDGYGLDGDGDDGMDPATKRARRKNLRVKRGGKRV